MYLTPHLFETGVRYFADGWNATRFAGAFGQARRVHADGFSFPFKLRLVVGQYLAVEYVDHYHAMANILCRTDASV